MAVCKIIDLNSSSIVTKITGKSLLIIESAVITEILGRILVLTKPYEERESEKAKITVSAHCLNDGTNFVQ